jgi:hypothetical protein
MDDQPNRAQFNLSPAGFICLLSALAVILFSFHLASHRKVHRPEGVFITEICAHNATGLLDQYGHHSDWVELYNSGTTTVNLEGWYLTDDFQQLKKWRFPAVNLGAGQYLIVFASGKDRLNPDEPLHTNFKLTETGSYLALVFPDGETVANDYFPKYPRQQKDVSFGLTAEAIQAGGGFAAAPQGHRFFQTPTPGFPNREERVGLVKDLIFSRESGFCEEEFKLRLTALPRAASIYYTLDGSMPTSTNSIRFTNAITIRSTTVIRAMAVAPGFVPSDVETRTYVFLKDVIRQSGSGLPGNWGHWDNWTAPAHYSMASEIVNDPNYHERLLEGLRSLPSLSIVTEGKNLFDPDNGIYLHSTSNGVAWERPIALEMLYADGQSAFRVNCGLRIQGGWNRRPEESPKHSLRLLFKKEYGPTQLHFPLFGTNGAVAFQTLTLRSGNNNSWLHWNAEERRRAEYARDQWMRDSLRDMGYPSARGCFVHVYLNGLYWGVYNLAERPSAPFVAANEGGARYDYDSRKANKILTGDQDAWNQMMGLANAGLRGDSQYQTFQQYVDLPELTDYLILNFYGANADWDRSSNWYAARHRPDGKFRFLVWDGERTLEGIDADSIDFDDDECPPRLFHKLAENAEYRLFFADRVQRLLFNGGPLSPAPAAKRYEALSRVLEAPLVAESARWGNYRRDLHQYKVGPYEFYKPDVHWRPEVERLLTQYFPQRPRFFLQQLQKRGLYPSIEAPAIQSDDDLTMRLTSPAGTIYYTLDGSDPRLAGGALCPTATPYAQPIQRSEEQVLKARVATGQPGAWEWSALVEN